MLFFAPARWLNNCTSQFHLEQIWTDRVGGVLSHSGRLLFLLEGRLSTFPPVVHRCSQRSGPVKFLSAGPSEANSRRPAGCDMK